MVLVGEALSIASIYVWGVNVGDGACAWRVPYSPRSGAFGIWSIIYTSTALLCVLQLASVVPALDLGASVLWAVAWLLCAVWVPLFDASSPRSLIFAAAAIGAAAACATAASWRAEAWRWTGEDPPLGLPFVLGLPLSLLAGWLLAASSIGVGVALKANAADAQSTCVAPAPARMSMESERQYQRRRRRRYREAFEAAPVEESPVPMLLAVAVAALAVGARDPALPLPVAWALLYQRTFPGVVTLCGMVECACGTAGALVYGLNS